MNTPALSALEFTSVMHLLLYSLWVASVDHLAIRLIYSCTLHGLLTTFQSGSMCRVSGLRGSKPLVRKRLYQDCVWTRHCRSWVWQTMRWEDKVNGSVGGLDGFGGWVGVLATCLCVMWCTVLATVNAFRLGSWQGGTMEGIDTLSWHLNYLSKNSMLVVDTLSSRQSVVRTWFDKIVWK